MLSGQNTQLMLRDKRCIAIGPALLLLTIIFWFSWTPGDAVSSAGRVASTDVLDAIPGSQVLPQEAGFTIIAPTFKRLETLPKFVEHYASGNITSLRRIIILWFDKETEVPVALQRQFDAYPIPVTVESRDDSLNERFRRSENVKTDCVLSIDDDMIIAPGDIEFGYQTWKEFGQGDKRMVGYISRAGDNGKYLIGRLKRYSIILTKSAFYHTHWMDVYWSKDTTMTGLREYVQKNNNCEDILMAFVTAHHTRTAPILIKAPMKDIGIKSGISSTGDHNAKRNACIQHFNDVLGNNTLVSTSLLIKNMQSINSEDTGVD